MKKIIIFLGVLFTFSLSAQTKLIAHKSHSGTSANFSLKEDGNLGLVHPKVIYYEDNEENRKSIESLTDSTMSSNFKITLIKAKEGLVFNKKSDFDKYKNLRAADGKLGLVLVILDESKGIDYELINRLTDTSMKEGAVRYYIKSVDGFIFETKSEYNVYQELRNKRKEMGIKICELEEDKDILKINQLTDSTMREGDTVFFIRTKDGAVFDLRSTFENYKKLREIKNKNGNIDFIMISKNDSMLKVVNDSVLVDQQDENRLTPFVYNKFNPTDKTPFLIVITSAAMIIIGFLLWKKEIKKINSKEV